MTKIEIVRPRDRAGVEAALALRRLVFCDEQGVPIEAEADAHDAHAAHLLALAGDGKAVGTLRWRPVEAGAAVKIERVAVLAPWRGRGIAKRLMRAAVARIAAEGGRVLVLHAQSEVVAFYAKLGFVVEGDEFVEENIRHRRMRRSAATAIPD